VHATSGRGWRVGDTSLLIRRDGAGGWELACVAASSLKEMSEWAQRAGLAEASFASRLEALRCVAAAMAAEAAPSWCLPVRLRRLGPGRYESPDGQTLIVRDGRGWAMTHPDHHPATASTLREASLLVSVRAQREQS
jgi:hypothetical protein